MEVKIKNVLPDYYYWSDVRVFSQFLPAKSTPEHINHIKYTLKQMLKKGYVLCYEESGSDRISAEEYDIILDYDSLHLCPHLIHYLSLERLAKNLWLLNIIYRVPSRTGDEEHIQNYYVLKRKEQLKGSFYENGNRAKITQS